MHYFPEPNHPDLTRFTGAFVRMMFAHAELEYRISDLLDCITGEPGFGQQPGNRVSAQKTTERGQKTVLEA